MELIFRDPYYDSVDEGKDYTAELKKLLLPYDNDASVFYVNIGHGADCPAYLVQFLSSIDWPTFLTASGVGATFLMGKKINENLDAWIKVAKKVENLVTLLSPSRIDVNAATLIALSELSENSELNGDLSISVQVIEFTPVPWGKFKLDKSPDALYIITIKTNGKAFIRGIKSNRKICFKHEYSLFWGDFVNT